MSQEDTTGRNLTAPSQGSRMISPRAASTSTIQAAIHSLAAPGETLKRINAVLALYFEPDTDPQAKAAIREEYVRALAAFPAWAMHRACDQWVKSSVRRPSPGELAILAGKEIQPFTDELARRKALEDAEREEEERRARDRVSPEAAARIMAEAGMTPDRLQMVKAFPMVGSTEEAAAKQEELRQPGKHWTEGADPEDPRWQALQASRRAAGIVKD